MSQYKTGTASVTNGSPTVTGTNTLWLANVTAGDSFTIASTGVMYNVASVDSDTQITLSAPYAGTTASGVVYAIGTGFTVPDSFPEMSQGDIETATIFTRAMRKIQGKFSGIVSDISGKAAIAGQVFTGDIEAPALDVLDDNGLAKIIVGSGSNIANSIHGIEFRDRYGASGFTDGQVGSYIRTLRNSYLGSYNLTFGTTASTGSDAVERMRIDKSGNITPGSDNTQTLGSASFRWSEVFAGTGTINTSDARDKTSVRGMTKSEVSAAKDFSKEIGIYQFLAAVEKKGDEARRHVGLTVQRAIEIMAAHGLEPFNYGFICFDAWDDIFVEHAEVLAVKAVEESEESEAVEAVEAREAWTEKTREAGDRYAFRYDQLNLFIARGIEARLSDLEDNA